MEIIAKKINLKRILLMLISFGYVSTFNNIAYGESINLENISANDFENSLSQNSSEFYEYENAKNLYDDFFGLNDPSKESPLKTNFQDLSLQIDSKNLRDLYKRKLLEMTKEKRTEYSKDFKNEWNFFNKKI